MTREETENLIARLPVRKLPNKTTGKELLVKFDAATGMGYLLDENGKWTGKAAKIAEPQVVEPDESADSGEGADKKSESTSGGSKSPTAKKDQVTDDTDEKKKKIILGALIAVAAIVIIVCILLAVKNLNGSATPGSDPTSESMSIEEFAVKESYDILIATKDLLCGDEIMPGDLTTATISKVEYASLGGCYLASAENELYGMKVRTLIPFGAPVPYSSCSNFFDGSVSPWADTSENAHYVDVPIVLEKSDYTKLCIGDTIDLTISRDNQKSTSNIKESGASGEMTYSFAESASTTTHKFHFPSVVIADFVNDNGDSLYGDYNKLLELPEGYVMLYADEKYSGENSLKTETCYIRIFVTEEQADLIGQLPAETTTITFKIVEKCPDNIFRERFMQVSEIFFELREAALTAPEE